MNDHAGYPVAACPRCKHEQVDLDGFGVVYCPACYYCTHPHLTNGVCGICGYGPPEHQRGR